VGIGYLTVPVLPSWLVGGAAVAHNRWVDISRQLTWRSAVVPVPAKGRVRVGPGPGAGTDPRERAIAAMVDWCVSSDRPLWLVEGAAATGKTRLVTDVADRLVEQRWPCGWARPGMAAYAVSAAARNGRQALVLIDDAETRGDLFEVLRTVVNGGTPLPVRVIVTARDFGPWWADLLARLTEVEREALAAGRTVMGRSGVAAASPRALQLRQVTGDGSDTKARAVAVLAAADPVSPAVLLRLAAVVVALSTRVGQVRPVDVRSALRDLFDEEEGYWWRTAEEVRGPGQPTPALRTALASAAMVGPDGLADAATVLRRVPSLAAGAADRLARLAVWWHGLYVRMGEYETPQPRLPGWLADRLPDGTDSTGVSWMVAALSAERRATSTLARLAVDAHREVWPSRTPAVTDVAAHHDTLRRTVALAAPVDEALAWLTQELDLGPAELDALGEAISYPTRSLTRTAIVLARRLLDNADTDEERAALTLGLGARYSEMGRWQDARQLTERATEELRKLVEHDRERHLTELAAAVSNLGSCLAQLGERDAALETTYEAVALHRELLERDRDEHLPAMARALTNLSACLSRAGRRPAALGAAGQAVAIYRELVALHPNAYRSELAAADHNWRICREALAAPVVGRAPVT
jgi:tetratricopeptide (TPR) repeat protein